MADLDALEHKAEMWSRQSEGIEQLSQSIDMLKSIAEQRQILAETDKTSIEAKTEKQHWTKVAALAPTIAALITGLTFGITFLYQHKQADIATQQSEESQWRAALQKVDASDPVRAEAGALAMVSFFPSKYVGQSRVIATALCSNIDDPRVFDFVVYQLYLTTDQNNQYDLLDVDRSISMQLRTIYENLPATDRGKQTFVEFLKDPAESADVNPIEASGTQQEVEKRKWELDTITNFLYALWTRSNPLSVSGLDLRGIIFWNDERRAFDRIPNIDKAEMSKYTAFLGKCSLGTLASRLPAVRPIIECDSH